MQQSDCRLTNKQMGKQISSLQTVTHEMALQSSATWQERKVDQTLEEFVAHIKKCLSVTKSLASGVQQRTQSWKSQGDRSKESFFKVSAILERASMYCISFTEDIQDWMNQNELGQGQNASPISASSSNNSFTCNSLIMSASSTSSTSVSVSQGEMPSSTVARNEVPFSQPSCSTVTINVPSSPPLSNNVDLTEDLDERLRNGNDQVKKEDVPSVREEGDLKLPEHSSTLAPSAHSLAHAPGHHNVKDASVRDDKHHRLSPRKKINLDLLDEEEKKPSVDEMNDDVTVSNFCNTPQETRSEPEVYIDRDWCLPQESTVLEEITDVPFSPFHHIPLETKSEPEVYIDTDCCLSEQATFQEQRQYQEQSKSLKTAQRLEMVEETQVKNMFNFNTDHCLAFSSPLNGQRHGATQLDDISTPLNQLSQKKVASEKYIIHDTNTVYANDEVLKVSRNEYSNDQTKIIDYQPIIVSSLDEVGKKFLPRKHKTGKGKNAFGWELCGKFCISNSRLQIHMRSHTGVKSFQCQDCGRKFNKKCNLRTHMRTHTGEKPFQCHICEKKFNYKSSRRKHMRTHTKEKPFQCHICEKKFSEKSNIRTHMRTHTGEKPFQCHICEKKCSHMTDLQRHIRCHTGEKPFQCHICEKKFIQRTDLQRHMRYHTGEKPFQCHICEKKFSLKCNLRMHMRSHTKERPFQCHICEKKCSRRTDLQSHMRTHTGEKPFQCHICEKKCSQRTDLQGHMRTHTGEKPFQCHICEKKFSLKSNLRRHMRSHTKERPFQCHICEKNYKWKSHLQRHMRSHTGEKPFRYHKKRHTLVVPLEGESINLCQNAQIQ